MKSRRHVPTIYVVHWMPFGIVKVGVTERKRWDQFTNRGAKLLALYEFEKVGSALELELAGHKWLEARSRGPAFQSADPLAVQLLGTRGGGYLECFGLDETMLRALLEHMLQVAREHGATHCLEAI